MNVVSNQICFRWLSDVDVVLRQPRTQCQLWRAAAEEVWWHFSLSWWWAGTPVLLMCLLIISDIDSKLSLLLDLVQHYNSPVLSSLWWLGWADYQLTRDKWTKRWWIMIKSWWVVTHLLWWAMHRRMEKLSLARTPTDLTEKFKKLSLYLEMSMLKGQNWRWCFKND